jgi:hypothetical protein
LGKIIVHHTELTTLSLSADFVVAMQYGNAVKFIIVSLAIQVKEKKIHVKVLINVH